MISTPEKILFALMVAVIMFGMGATIDRTVLRDALARRRPFLVGMASQFVLMPALAWALGLALGLEASDRFALILLGCLPGGTTSNMFAHFARGDVALSIAMTTASTLVAMILTPLLVAFWAAGAIHELTVGEGLRVPLGEFAATLAAVLIPVAGGMWLRTRSPGWAKVAEETAGFAGLLVIVLIIASALPRNWERLLSSSPGQYAACIGLGLAGFTFGAGAARALGLLPRHRRTVALETGIQNAPISFAIILLSFPPALQARLLWLPMLYALWIVITASVATLCWRRRGQADWEAWQHELVQQRLFGRVLR